MSPRHVVRDLDRRVVGLKTIVARFLELELEISIRSVQRAWAAGRLKLAYDATGRVFALDSELRRFAALSRSRVAS